MVTLDTLVFLPKTSTSHLIPGVVQTEISQLARDLAKAWSASKIFAIKE